MFITFNVFSKTKENSEASIAAKCEKTRYSLKRFREINNSVVGKKLLSKIVRYGEKFRDFARTECEKFTYIHHKA